MTISYFLYYNLVCIIWTAKRQLRTNFPGCSKNFLGLKYKMARKHRSRRSTRRRSHKARKSSRAITAVPRGLAPFAPRYITKMKYSETITTAASGIYQFRLNSVFDPNLFGVGHQSYGFDTLSEIYNKYRVISCGWRIQRAQLATDTPVLLGCLPSNDVGIAYTTFSEVRENPRARYITQNAGAGVVTLRGKSYLPSLLGRTRVQYMADDETHATVLTNPAESAILYLFTAEANDVPAAKSIQVLLEYTVEFFDPKHLVQS